MPTLKEAHINPLGFREYDARWLYPKDINKEGIKNVGRGLGTQIISKKARTLLRKERWEIAPTSLRRGLSRFLN